MIKFTQISIISTISAINGQRMQERFITDCIINISHIVNIHMESSSIKMIDDTWFILTEESFNELLETIELA